jgi:RNA polymerase sigma-70 factor (ECF subfamily)
LLDPDVRLMLQVRQGSAVAYEQLVAKYQRRVIAFFQHAVTPELAEDLAQEVFLRVYRARETYQPGARFATWLFTIVHNVASNAIRRRQLRKEINVDVAQSGEYSPKPLDTMAQAASGTMPTRRADKREAAEMVSLAIQALNERQKTAILLSKFENMSYQEIAEAMGLTTQAVKSLLSRARANLKEILEPYIKSGLPPDTSRRVEDDE